MNLREWYLAAYPQWEARVVGLRSKIPLWAAMGALTAGMTLVPGSMIVQKQRVLNTGTPVVLETLPIDPRDLFRGDYVRLNYHIHLLNTAALAGDDTFQRHQAIYVVLEPQGEFWRPTAVWNQHPGITPGRVVIRGEVKEEDRATWVSRENMTPQEWAEVPEETKQDYAKSKNPQWRTFQVKRVRVVYHIENYFVPEGEGRVLERPNLGEKVSLRVVVDDKGTAAIQQVLINGQPRYTETLW
ncbi:MAG: GDYXXLXY domain-containing protein [Deltaproteobacteria bacterium]|nr:GDYXXLXY domain-containing protein [Deltaproteobacteria bacterium]